MISRLVGYCETVSGESARLHTPHLCFCSRRAAAVTRSLLRKAPTDPIRNTPELLGMLGHAYVCEHRMPEAVNAFERAVKASPAWAVCWRLAPFTVRSVANGMLTLRNRRLRYPPKTIYDFTQLETFQKNRAQTRTRSAPAGANGPT